MRALRNRSCVSPNMMAVLFIVFGWTTWESQKEIKSTKWPSSLLRWHMHSWHACCADSPHRLKFCGAWRRPQARVDDEIYVTKALAENMIWLCGQTVAKKVVGRHSVQEFQKAMRLFSILSKVCNQDSKLNRTWFDGRYHAWVLHLEQNIKCVILWYFRGPS